MTDKKFQRRRIIALFWILLFLGILFLVLSLIINPSIENWSIAFLAALLRDISFLFAPIALLALLYQYFVESRIEREIVDQVTVRIIRELDQRMGEIGNAAEEVTASIIHELVQRLGEIGDTKEVVTIYPTRQAINFNDFFTSAKENIDILVTNLQSMQEYIGLLLEKAKAGIDVRILALNPLHPFVQNRFAELRLKNEEFFQEEMVSSLGKFCSKRKSVLNTEQQKTEQQKTFQIKIYNNPPTLMIFRSDNRVIIGFILRQGRSREYMHIEFNIESTSKEPRKSLCFIKHFQKIWEQLKEINYDEVESTKLYEKKDENKIAK